MKRLKIIYCLVFYLPNRLGGIEVYVQALARELKNKGHEVKIMVPDYPGESIYPLELDGIPIITYPEFSNMSREEFRGDIPGRGLKGFINCLKNEKPDIVHFHQLTSSNGISLFHIKAAKKTGARVVFTNHLAGLTCATGRMLYKNETLCDGIINPLKCSVCHISGFPVPTAITGSVFEELLKYKHLSGYLGSYSAKVLQFFSSIRNIKNRKRKLTELIRISDKFIVLTRWYYQVLEKNGFLNHKVRLIKQALPFYPINNIKKNISATKSPLRLIYVGRIFPDKGLHILLKALQSLDDKEFQLGIFGQVDGKEYFEKCKDLIGTRKNVSWFPSIANSEMINTIANYDLLVLPSVVSEMAPLVIYESWAAGVPVVGTNTGGIAEEIQHEYNGWLFNMGDVDGLKEIISHIIKDPGLLSEASSNLPEARFFEKVAEEVEEVYLNLL